MRFSTQSKTFFNNLKNITKYHLFERSKGAIVTTITDENGNVERDAKQVNQALIEALKLKFGVVLNQNHRRQVSLPPAPGKDLILNLMTMLNSNKALSQDIVDDIILYPEFDNQGEPTKRTKKKIQVLQSSWGWLNDSRFQKNHFAIKVVPINKVSPKIPTVNDVRPISVQSPILKFIESTLLSKLQQYLKHSMVKSQVGFVPQLSTEVNLQRLMDELSSMKAQGLEICYAIFIDIKAAYDTVPREVLFTRLETEGILTTEETNLLRLIYDNTRLTIGDKEFRPQKGVLQGSVISPALFDIFFEGLLRRLIENGISWKRLFGFADDLSSLTPSVPEASKILRLIDDWLASYGLSANKSKSGIVCIKLRKHSKFDPSGSIRGYPFVTSYKYLGVSIDKLLNFKSHIEKVRRKINFIAFKLGKIPKRELTPFFFVNMWQIFCKSLLDYGNIIYRYTPLNTLEEVKKLYRLSLKKVLRISTSTPNRLIEALIGVDLDTQLNAKEERLRRIWQQYLDPSALQSDDLADHNAFMGDRHTGDYDNHHLTWDSLRAAQFYPNPKVTCPTCGEMASIAHAISASHVITQREKQLLDTLEVRDGVGLTLALIKRGLQCNVREELNEIIHKAVAFMDYCYDYYGRY